MASTQDSDDDEEEDGDENSISKSAKDKGIATVMTILKSGISSTLRVNSVKSTMLRKQRKIKQLERKNKEKEKMRFERMERDLKALGLKSDMLGRIVLLSER